MDKIKSGIPVKGAIVVIVVLFIVLCAILANMLINGNPTDKRSDDMNDVSMSTGVNIDVVRLTNESISIRVTGGEKLSDYDTGRPFDIMIGEANASNASAIKESGLTLAMTPGDRLMGTQGSSVVLTGKEVTSIPYTAIVDNQTVYRTDSTHVRVFGYHTSGVRICLMDKAV
jgi:hypothetical protein